jgi:hypothetical protein
VYRGGTDFRRTFTVENCPVAATAGIACRGQVGDSGRWNIASGVSDVVDGLDDWRREVNREIGYGLG